MLVPQLRYCDLFEFGFALFEAFDIQVSAASQNTNQFLKFSQSMLNFQSCRAWRIGKHKGIRENREDVKVIFEQR
jgi:hypothetical protein